VSKIFADLGGVRMMKQRAVVMLRCNTQGQSCPLRLPAPGARKGVFMSGTRNAQP
jgi:hypothetical protein